MGWAEQPGSTDVVVAVRMAAIMSLVSSSPGSRGCRRGPRAHRTQAVGPPARPHEAGPPCRWGQHKRLQAVPCMPSQLLPAMPIVMALMV